MNFKLTRKRDRLTVSKSLIFRSEFFVDSKYANIRFLHKGYSEHDMPRQIMSEELFCVALFSEDNYFYRCQIKKICDLTNTLKVLYIDYGNEGWVSAHEVTLKVGKTK